MASTHGAGAYPRVAQRLVSIGEFNSFLQFSRERGGSSYMVALIGCTVAMTGRRRAEILSLTKAALKPGGFMVRDCKTKYNEPERIYQIEWSDILRQIVREVGTIKQHNSDKGRVATIYLFGTEDEGTPYTDAGFSCLWNRLMHAYAPGGPTSAQWFRPHDLRALYVTQMLDQKRDPKTHKNQQTMIDVYERSQQIKVSPLA